MTECLRIAFAAQESDRNANLFLSHFFIESPAPVTFAISDYQQEKDRFKFIHSSFPELSAERRERVKRQMRSNHHQARVPSLTSHLFAQCWTNET